MGGFIGKPGLADPWLARDGHHGASARTPSLRQRGQDIELVRSLDEEPR